MSTNQRSVWHYVNQSKISIVLCQPIRDQYRCVSTNQNQVFTSSDHSLVIIVLNWGNVLLLRLAVLSNNSSWSPSKLFSLFVRGIPSFFWASTNTFIPCNTPVNRFVEIPFRYLDYILIDDLPELQLGCDVIVYIVNYSHLLQESGFSRFSCTQQ